MREAEAGGYLLEAVVIFSVDVYQSVGAIHLIGTGWQRPLRGLLDHFHAVILIQLIVFDHFYQFVGIGAIGGVSALLQPLGPAFVVGDAQVEQARVARPFSEEPGVVGVRLLHGAVFAEAFPFEVVVMIDPCAFPFVAFDAEVVVRAAC